MAQAHSQQTTDDDLTAVLGRFRAWNQNTDNPPDEPGQAAEVPAGLQEMTYEEALGARIRRVSAKSPVMGSEGPRARLAEHYGDPGLRPASPAVALSKATARPVSAASTRRSAVPVKVLPAVKQQGTRFVPSSGQANALKKSRKSSSPVTRQSAGVKQKAIPQSSAPYFYGSRPGQLAGEGHTPRRPQPSFRDVLEDDLETSYKNDRKVQASHSRVSAESIRNASASHADASSESHGDAKSIAMKLRVSPQEHAKIKAGAAEAGVTLAAYMRQCTLDVKVLRGLLTQTIADLQALPGPSARTEAVSTRRSGFSPDEPEREGLLARLIIAFFGPKTRRKKKPFGA